MTGGYFEVFFKCQKAFTLDLSFSLFCISFLFIRIEDQRLVFIWARQQGVNFINVFFARFFCTNVLFGSFSSYVLALAPKFRTKNACVNVDEIDNKKETFQWTKKNTDQKSGIVELRYEFYIKLHLNVTSGFSHISLILPKKSSPIWH